MKERSGIRVSDNNDNPIQISKGEAEALTYWRHEIMARLSVISLGSSMLRETLGETLSERQIVLLATIEHSTDDLSRLIKGLLDFPVTRQREMPAA
jgi:signal transduction histidine kinase